MLAQKRFQWVLQKSRLAHQRGRYLELFGLRPKESFQQPSLGIASRVIVPRCAFTSYRERVSIKSHRRPPNGWRDIEFS